MNEYTEIAAKWPCYFAIEAAHPRFAHKLGLGSLVLTINTGYE